MLIWGKISVVLDVECCVCGRHFPSEPIDVEMRSWNFTELRVTLEQLKVGRHFPVGWASFLRDGKDVYQCPKCLTQPARVEVPDVVR